MAKQHNIRWSNKDDEKLKKLVKNFNAKITRASKRDPSIINFLPEKLSVKNLRNEIGSRKDFNKLQSTAKRFAKKGSEKLVESGTGYQLTKFELLESKNAVRVQNIINTRKRKQSGISVEKGNSKQAKERGIDFRKFKVGTSLKELRKVTSAIQKNSSTATQNELLAQYRKNYIMGIAEMGAKSIDFLRIVSDLSDQELFDMTNENPKLVIDFYYDDNFSQEELSQGILQEWRNEVEKI